MPICMKTELSLMDSDQGVHMPCFLPKMKPSYQDFTSSLLEERPYSSNAVYTSDSVKPKESSYFAEVVVMTEKDRVFYTDFANIRCNVKIYAL